MADTHDPKPEQSDVELEHSEAGAKLAGFSMRYPVTVCMVFVLMITSGVIATSRIPLEMMPNLTFPFLGIFIPYSNSSPAQTQEAIVKPIEEVLATVPGVQRMVSRAGSDFSFVELSFKWGQDVGFLRSEIREKIDQIRNDLPDDLRQIQIRNFGTDDFPILVGQISSGRDLRAAYDLLDVKIKQSLERLPGVAEVELWGVNRQEIDIYLRLDDLKRYKVDVSELFQKLNEINIDRSLGEIDAGDARYGAIAQSAIESVDELRNFPVNERGLRLEQIADIDTDSPPLNSGRHLNGNYATGFALRKAAGANTVEVVESVLTELDEIGKDPALRGIDVLVWFNQGEQVYTALSGLTMSGITGAVLAVVVLWLFLRKFSATLIVGLSIPFSLLAATGFLYFTDNTLNVLTMMGLMLATGMLVDNAVVVLESIYQKLEQGVDRFQAVVEGTQEVMTAVVAATLTSIIIFVPLIFGKDSEFSIFLGNAGISIVFALLASLFISLTLIPLAMGRWIRVDVENRSRLETWFVGVVVSAAQAFGRKPDKDRPTLTDRYLDWVDWPLKHKFLMGLVVVPLTVAGSIYWLTNHVPDNSADASEMESLNLEYDFSENFHYAKIEADYVVPVEQFLLENRERFQIKDVYSQYGNNRANTEIYFDLTKVGPEEMEELREEITEELPEIPGAKIGFRGGEGQNQGKWVQANIIGPDPAILSELAAEAERRMRQNENVQDTWSGASSGEEEVQIRLRRDLASRVGVTPQSVAGTLGIVVRGSQLRGFRGPDGEVDIFVRLRTEDLQDLGDLKAMVVGGTEEGKEILLENVADLQVAKVASQLRRENRQTYTQVSMNWGGEQAGDGRELLEEVMDGLDYPQGYSWSVGFWTRQGDAEQMDFVFNLLLALFMVYFVMAALFESIVHPFAIMLSMPFAMVGVTWFLYFTGTPNNIMAMIGTLVLIGIVVNNGIVLLDHINNLRRQGVPRPEAIRRGCRERFRPICMTAATTIVGLAPLAVGTTSLAGMRYFPMARTVMGGLIASTALTLIVLPTYYVLMDDLAQWARRLWFGSAPRRRESVEAPAGD